MRDPLPTSATGFAFAGFTSGARDFFKGGLDSLTGGGENEGEKTETGEDPEVVAARLEQEERRKEKHRKMEAEREKMREGIRSKYNIQKKEEGGAGMDFGTDGRIGAARKKTPEELAAEMNAEDDSIIGQLGMTEHVEKAKTAITGAFETVKGFLPFGK
uniref:Putative complexin-1 n=1 Tax=Pristionchus pacificus TaxID=54126 RepID=A0A2A6BJM7_PRIPA|eukprot:PDM66043.1 cpx-1 [Pristionchus pacificus]